MKAAAVILEHANRPPFASQDQLRKTVSIQIAENRTADQSKIGEKLAVSGASVS